MKKGTRKDGEKEQETREAGESEMRKPKKNMTKRQKVEKKRDEQRKGKGRKILVDVDRRKNEKTEKIEATRGAK